MIRMEKIIVVLLGVMFATAQEAVDTFQAKGEGTTWINVEWTIDPVPDDIYKYTINKNGLNNDVVCHETVCNNNYTNLDSCKMYVFSITPYYGTSPTSLTPGPSSTTNDTTLDIEPQTPLNGQYSLGPVERSTIHLTWDPPNDATCANSYEVCYTAEVEDGLFNDTTGCMMVPDTSAEIANSIPCILYQIEVRTVSVSGLESKPLRYNAHSRNAVPGEPINLTVTDVSSVSATLTWDDPTENPQCVNRYDVTWFKVGDLIPVLDEKSSDKAGAQTEGTSGENSFVVSPLVPCSNYSFQVYAVSFEEKDGPIAITFGETEETTPETPGNVILVPTGPESINVTWEAGDGTCVGSYQICFTDPVALTVNCTDVAGNSGSYEIEGLRACTDYTITVTPISPNGVVGDPVTATKATQDDYPGSPENLVVTNSTIDSITISYETPLINGQCVNEYEVDTIDLYLTNIENEPSGDLFKKDSRSVMGNVEVGLDSCTDYLIRVRGITPTGLQGSWAEVNSRTLEGIPSIVQNLQSVTETSSTIEISWFAPKTNPRCVDHYRINWSSGNGITNATAGQYNFRFTLTGLTSGTAYNIGVTGYTISDERGASTAILGNTVT